MFKSKIASDIMEQVLPYICIQKMVWITSIGNEKDRSSELNIYDQIR